MSGGHPVGTDTDARRWPTGAGTLDEVLDVHRRELRGHCRRILGSGFEADDAVQETMVRAWCRIDGFEGRSSLRSWLYRIATNVCLDMRGQPQRRARPIDPEQSSSADGAPHSSGAEPTWVPAPHARGTGPHESEPAELAESRDAVRVAFVAALQLLPPRQRAVLILREVLRWQAREVAELLDTSVASVNSALQRARVTLETVSRETTDPAAANAEQRALLARYLDAFERYDVASLVTLARTNP